MRVSNHLAGENSPYLLQHAGNPVEWYPWGPDAFEKAVREDKPIFLSIGYAACHWCHVMAHESFEDPQTAAIMNEHFVNIKVDREERPDVDSIYMGAVVAMIGQGGWPLSLFLTPEKKPFYGGTYFPPQRRYNLPSFQEILLSVARAWEQSRSEILESSDQIAGQLNRETRSTLEPQVLKPELLSQAARTLIDTYDWKTHGWGGAPRFPQPMAIEFLLRRSLAGEPDALKTAIDILDAMSRGGMYDVVGGGFARYSTDIAWHVPHFEKMLYDNAQLARVYLHAYLLSGQLIFRSVAEETLDFILRELADPSGGFYSSLDADSEGQEGKYYLWTLEQIREVIIDPKDLEFFVTAYGVKSGGNFEGATVLQRVLDDAQLGKKFDLAPEEARRRLQELHRVLFDQRQKRVRPGTDDKVLTAWNGLALAALAEAGRYLERPDYLAEARKNALFLTSNLYLDHQLIRSWRGGQARISAYLEDYAALIQGLLALYQTDPDPAWFACAVDLTNQMIAHFKDETGGFFDTRDDQEKLFMRPKEVQDNATPSGSSLAAGALFQMSAYSGNGEWRDIAEGACRPIQALAGRYPAAFAGWLQDLDFALGHVFEVAVLGDLSDPRTQSLYRSLWSSYRPNMVAAISPYPPEKEAPALLQDRPLLSNNPTAYVCQHFICLKPVNDPKELIELLK